MFKLGRNRVLASAFAAPKVWLLVRLEIDFDAVLVC